MSYGPPYAICDSLGGTLLTLNVDLAYKDEKKSIRELKRSLEGHLYSYTFANYQTFEVPVTHVDTSVVYQLDVWWQEQQSLVFVVESTTFTNCLITNKTQPCRQRIPYYPSLFKGKLLLEQTVDV